MEKDFLSLSHEWFWETDASRVITYSNEAVVHFLGYSSTELLGKNFFDFIPNSWKEQIKDKRFCEKSETHCLLPFLDKGGVEKWLQVTCVPLIWAGKIRGHRGVSHLVDTGKSLDEIKKEFIALVSHELRTPLTAIYGALRLLHNNELETTERSELIKAAYNGAERLVAVVNNIVEISEKMAQVSQKCLSVIFLDQIVQKAIETLASRAKNLSVVIDIKGFLPPLQIYAEEEKILLAVTNLLSNAIKFSPTRTAVSIELTRKEETAVLTITNHGKRIPDAFRDKIFVPFQQAYTGDAREAEGLGLGLAITKQIIESFGGTIDYRSSDEETAFFFTLPLFQDTCNYE